MTSTKKDPVIVVLQLTGGNDYFNTVSLMTILYIMTIDRTLSTRGKIL